jgi:hypothetical protein
VLQEGISMNGKYRRGLILGLAVFGCIGLVSLANGHEFLAANGVNDNKYCASIYFGTNTSSLGTNNGGDLTNFTVKNIAKPTLASTANFVAGSTAAGGVLKFGSGTSNKGTATFTFATGLYISNISVYAWSKSTAQTMTISTSADTAGKTINFTNSTTVPDLTESEDLPLTSESSNRQRGFGACLREYNDESFHQQRRQKQRDLSSQDRFDSLECSRLDRHGHEPRSRHQAFVLIFDNGRE